MVGRAVRRCLEPLMLPELRRYPWIVAHTCRCLLEVIRWQQYIVMIFGSLLSGNMQELLLIHSF